MLPPDIEEEILGHLRDDEDTLKATALTCRSFLQPSQKLLYAKITLELHHFKGPERTTSLRKVLDANSHLCRYIRHLEILAREREWLSRDTSMADVLGLLKNIQVLVIDYRGQRSGPSMLWRGDFLSALLSILQLPSLKCLSLSNCPLELIEHGRHLARLSIHGSMSSQPLSPPLSVDCHGKLDLDFLEFQMAHGSEHDVVRHLRCAIDPRNLRKISAKAANTFDGHNALFSVLQDCADALINLAFVPAFGPKMYEHDRENINPATDPIDWTILTSLRTFATEVTLHAFYDGRLMHSFHWLVQVLSQLSLSNRCLEEITIQANFTFRIPHANILPNYWDKVIALLLDRPSFPSLRKVEIVISSLEKRHIEDLMLGFENYATKLREGSNQRFHVSLTMLEAFEPSIPFFA